ncbi:tRNA-(guanine-N1)-methyltransferase [Pseudovibrio japonicus]|uniref:tRNA-(Guanine-N1)-methyltransferase n=1 Tax=Pseudovibrio japonicus TaxID=366534 RepID=A0ABQ3EKA7_9HYPH|nr:nitrite reductase small subunit NirD [Pseudovibrio japonicus]GHB35236.1 tRNA-(guanine-N1)-methyltransferase [Pseudovibrio japonicus]
MNAQTTTFVEIGSLGDIPIRGSRRVELNGERIAIFRSAADEVFALKDECPHKKGPLSEGIVHDGCVTCPMHNWVISLETGEAQGADEGRVLRYPVKIKGNMVLLGVTPEGA